MTPKEFIESKLKKLREPSDAPRMTGEKEVSDFIIQRILSKKFRKFSVEPEYLIHVQELIRAKVHDNLPIKFSFPFGAYKLWRLNESPEADWAELFTLMYYARWLQPIAEMYKPGIIFEFFSDEVIIERLNNIPPTDTERYAESFRTLFDFLGPHTPDNMKFLLTPIRSLYSKPEDFEANLQEKIEQLQKEWGGLPTLDATARASVELNVQISPEQAKDPLWAEKVELVHRAYYLVDRRKEYIRAADNILVFPTKIRACIPVGTTKTSVAKFWVGIGALKKVSDGFMEYVLSPSQLKSLNFVTENISIEGLEGKNFSKIRIF